MVTTLYEQFSQKWSLGTPVSTAIQGKIAFLCGHFHVRTVQNDTDAPQINLDCSVKGWLNNQDKIWNESRPSTRTLIAFKAKKR